MCQCQVNHMVSFSFDLFILCENLISVFIDTSALFRFENIGAFELYSSYSIYQWKALGYMYMSLLPFTKCFPECIGQKQKENHLGTETFVEVFNLILGPIRTRWIKYKELPESEIIFAKNIYQRNKHLEGMKRC